MPAAVLKFCFASLILLLNTLLLCLLIEHGELSVGQLQATVDLSQSALSQHLARMREDGLVGTRREAQTIYYSLADGPAHRIIETLHGIYCGSKPHCE